jgi:hypothetical protein
MNDDYQAILNDPELIAVRNSYMDRLADLRRPDYSGPVFVLDGIGGRGGCDPYLDPERWVAGALQDLAERAKEAGDPYVFRPLAVEFIPYGVHFVDKILGSDVFFEADQWYNRPLATPVGELTPPNLDNDPTWRLATRFALAFRDADVELPVLGLPVIASVLNIAVNVYGEGILTTMAMQPERAARDLQTINSLLCEMHAWYRQTLPASRRQPVVATHRTQPPDHGQICGCTTQLLSAAMYTDLIAPLDDALLSVYPNGGLIHLCGAHVQHIPAWRAMKSLRAVQLNDRAALDLEIYVNGLRDDQVIYLNPFPGMTAERALEITGGRRLVLVGGYGQLAKGG